MIVLLADKIASAVEKNDVAEIRKVMLRHAVDAQLNLNALNERSSTDLPSDSRVLSKREMKLQNINTPKQSKELLTKAFAIAIKSEKALLAVLE